MPKSSVNRKVFGTLVGIVAAVVLFFYSFHIILGLFGLMALLAVYGRIARKRGWGGEGRLTRYLSRPPFENQSRRSN